MTTKKSVSLALGSGGARGMAHIGVIRWLEQHDYEITAISGSSIGALIGGIYSTGKLDTYETWVKALKKSDTIRLLDFAYSLSGLFSGDRIMKKLEEMLGDASIEDLPISFTAVATDLDNMREVWFNKGSLFRAIRASIAIPTLFTPVQYHGRILVDGGLLNPVPIAPTLRNISDITVAVSLSGKDVPAKELFPDNRKPAPEDTGTDQTAISRFIESIQEHFTRNDSEEDETNIVDVVTRSIESMQNTIARFKLAAYNPNYLLEIPANACDMFDFHRAGDLIELGYRSMDKLMASSNG